MARKPKSPEQAALDGLREQLTELRRLLPTLSRPAAKKAIEELFLLMNEIEEARSDLDPIKDPGASFDPTNPETAGRVVALALLAQDKIPLGRIARTYGSGVYAIYYYGAHPAYAPISGTETPIYVGKADPQQADARNSRDQGPRLFGRLSDHRKMIRIVGEYAAKNNLPNALRIEDFKCRRLVCATNAQLVAEKHLINTFFPVWNNEVHICWGISKHGDAATTRANKRSPWDVMHPGRVWAMAEILEDQSTPDRIMSRLAEHFAENPPYKGRARIIHTFLTSFVQNAPMTSEAVAAAEDKATTEETITSDQI